LVVPRTGRRKAVLELIDREREQLVGWERRRKSCQALVLRCWIVLRCAAGLSNTEVAVVVGVAASRVGKWRSRFCELRLEGLVDDLRPGRPARITTEQVEEVLVATLESTPPERDALDACVDRQAQRPVEVHGRSDLADV
jgi:transposase